MIEMILANIIIWLIMAVMAFFMSIQKPKEQWNIGFWCSLVIANIWIAAGYLS